MRVAGLPSAQLAGWGSPTACPALPYSSTRTHAPPFFSSPYMRPYLLPCKAWRGNGPAGVDKPLLMSQPGMPYFASPLHFLAAAW